MVLQRHRQRLKGQGLPYAYPFRIIDRHGNTRWVQLSSALITWEGSPATLNCLSDISDLKEAEDELRQSQQFGTNLLNNSPNPILVINPDRSVKYVNPALEAFTGFSGSELTGASSLPTPGGPRRRWTRHRLTSSRR